jgi:hypothetical protein
MFLIRFFTGSIIGWITGVIVLVIGLGLLFVVAVGALAATGKPADCTPGDGPIVVDTAHADAFKVKWDGFSKVLDAGSPSSVSLTESEISSRADTYLRQKGAPIKAPRVCIHDGDGDAQAQISFLGLTVHFKVKGTLDLSGGHPKAKIDSMEVGNVPGFLLKPVRSYINRAIDSQLNSVTLDHHYTLTLKPGQADVGGAP